MLIAMSSCIHASVHVCMCVFFRVNHESMYMECALLCVNLSIC